MTDRERELTDQVLASLENAPSPRVRAVLHTLVEHLHAAVREVRPTEAEWLAAIDFLTRTGQACDERRQEFVLLSDVLGVSMLTVAVNAAEDPAVTASTVLGPFFVPGSPRVEPGGALAGDAPGTPCWVEGVVRDTDGAPVAGARIEVWEADETGRYDVQYDGGRTAGRGHLVAGSDGGFRFWCVRPTAYPIPTDGPVGELLAAAGRAAMRPAHLHLMVEAPGRRRLVTHVFVAGDPHLDDDAVFGVVPSLVAEFSEHGADEAPPPGGPAAAPWCSLRFDVTLAPAP